MPKNGSRVVGPDQVQLPPTSPLALSSSGGEREREREPGIHNFFFVNTAPREWSSTEISWQVVKARVFRIYCVYLFVVQLLLIITDIKMPPRWTGAHNVEVYIHNKTYAKRMQKII